MLSMVIKVIIWYNKYVLKYQQRAVFIENFNNNLGGNK